LSPVLFTRYVCDLINTIVDSHIGCHVGNLCINVLAYADDMVLLTPSWQAMQQLLDILLIQTAIIDMTCNTKKTVCMVFYQGRRNAIDVNTLPLLKIGSEHVQYVHSFKYLGHILSCDSCDDADIRRELRNLFFRTNVLIRKFSKCTIKVKRLLFRTFCLCLYDIALWSTFNAYTMMKLRSAYNRCVKTFFGYHKYDSVTKMLGELGLPSFDTLLVNSRFSMQNLRFRCNNSLVQHTQQYIC
jgi:hypothetical protein